MLRARVLICYFFLSALIPSYSQNLIVNPGAELMPDGTGWVIVATGNSVCAPGTAADTYSNWTMVPDASANYPPAHGGTKTFFAGCNVPASGTFELSQQIDVSANALQIDLNNVTFLFSGYIQTPISSQGDAGRFTIDYLNASNIVLGTSYSVTQSGTGGSGNAWNLYSNQRTAPAGTRSIRIRLISIIATGPAINAYFDDLSLVGSYLTPLPLTLVSFTANDSAGMDIIKWEVADVVNVDRFEIEGSTNGLHFQYLNSVDYVLHKTRYRFVHPREQENKRKYYRLRIVDRDGTFAYSPVVAIHAGHSSFLVSPNPASGNITINGLQSGGQISIRSITGIEVYRSAVWTASLNVSTSSFPRGLYIVSYYSDNAVTSAKLLVQ